MSPAADANLLMPQGQCQREGCVAGERETDRPAEFSDQSATTSVTAITAYREASEEEETLTLM